jgi:hypothetical protein
MLLSHEGPDGSCRNRNMIGCSEAFLGFAVKDRRAFGEGFLRVQAIGRRNNERN